MSEAKNIFAILDELKGNAKQIDNEGLESVEKTDHRSEKNLCWRCRAFRICSKRIFKQIDASWISGVCHWRNFNTTYESWRSIDHNIWVRRTDALVSIAKSQRIWTISWTCYNESAIHTGENADGMIILPGDSKGNNEEKHSIQPMGSQFEQMSF